MAHTKFSDLADLAEELKVIRTWENIREKSPGVFYYKSQPFLHFHDKNGARWAGLKEHGEWVRVDIAFAATQAAKARLLREAKSAYGQMQKK